MTLGPWWRRLPQYAIILAFLAMVAVHLFLPYRVFQEIIIGWGVYSYRFVFLDTDTVLSAARCVNRGVDPYLTNPCDDLQRAFVYSPVWLSLRVFPMTEAWLVPIGLIVVCSFMASLFLLPRSRSLSGALLLTLGVLSSTTAFAMERGNSDLVLFTLAACGAALCVRSRSARYCGYACFLLAGLLKYYPFALLAIAAKEPPRRLMSIAAAAIAVTAIVVIALWSDVLKAFANIPDFGMYFNWFGAKSLAFHLGTMLTLGEGAQSGVRLALTALALFIGLWLATRPRTRVALDGLTPAERIFLIAGALLMTSCFFASLNIWYRTIHILLTMPALIALSGGSAPKRYNFALLAGIALLWWNPVWRDSALNFIASDENQRAIYLLMLALWRELCWWFLMVIYLSFIFRFCLDGPVAKALFRSVPALRMLDRGGEATGPA